MSQRPDLTARRPAGPDGRSIMSQGPSLVMALVAVALVVFAVVRWRDNGWGALVWLAAFIATFAIRTPYAIGTRANVVTEERRDVTEMVLLAAMFATMMGLPLLHLATGAFAFADYALPAWASWIGAALQVPYLWLFWRSHADLGRNWSPSLEVREGHGLVTVGVYRRIRHPMYAAIWIAALAQPLLIQNWIAGFLILAAFAAMWFIRVPEEEEMMRRRFGAEYDAYRRRTGRLLPRR